MQLEIDDSVGIRPADVAKKSIHLKLVKHEQNDDCVLLEKRKRNDGKGDFDQYALFGVDTDGVQRSVRYLFGRDLMPLTKAWGKESTKWINNTVEISAEEDKKNSEYMRLVLTPREEVVN